MIGSSNFKITIKRNRPKVASLLPYQLQSDIITLTIRYVYIYLKIASGVTHLLSINLTVGYCTHNIDWKGIILYML